VLSPKQTKFHVLRYVSSAAMSAGDNILQSPKRTYTYITMKKMKYNRLSISSGKLGDNITAIVNCLEADNLFNF